MAFPALPGLTGNGAWFRTRVFRSSPACGVRAMPEIGDPDSDDHQLSMTWAASAPYLFSRFWYMVMMAGSDRSPARNKAFSDLRPPRLPISVMCLLSESSFRMARSAVGAVNMVLTLYSSTILQNEDASGVSTGLPS